MHYSLLAHNVSWFGKLHWVARCSLLKPLLAEKCELCGSRENVEVHHMRKLADLEKGGRERNHIGSPIMAGRRRKTLVVCHFCHAEIVLNQEACLARSFIRPLQTLLTPLRVVVHLGET